MDATRERTSANIPGAIVQESNCDLFQETSCREAETSIVPSETAPLINKVSSSPEPYSAFPIWQKRYLVALVSFGAFLSPTSANIYFPALNLLQRELKVSSSLINLTITSYMVFQGLAPALIGDLADAEGRRPAYILAFSLYLAANIGLALQSNYWVLLFLRCLQSSGSSGAVALGYGVVADISSSSERGAYMGFMGGVTMLGPALGPVIGGVLAQCLGWRSIFWFLAIVGGIYLILVVLTIPETARNIAGNGSIPLRGFWRVSLLEYLRQSRPRVDAENVKSDLEQRKLRIPNPIKAFQVLGEKDMALVLLYNGFCYTAFYCLMASIPSLYTESYHFNDLQIGLCYLPFGIGCAIAGIGSGRLLDLNWKRVARQLGLEDKASNDKDVLRYFPIEQTRLQVVWPFLITGFLSVSCYGWCVQAQFHLAVPMILMFFIGLCINGTFTVLSILVVDLYPNSPATASAANNLVRCFMGAGGTAIIVSMIKFMGVGWCFTLIGFIGFVTMPMLWLVSKNGPKWREERLIRAELAAVSL